MKEITANLTKLTKADLTALGIAVSRLEDYHRRWDTPECPWDLKKLYNKIAEAEERLENRMIEKGD